MSDPVITAAVNWRAFVKSLSQAQLRVVAQDLLDLAKVRTDAGNPVCLASSLLAWSESTKRVTAVAPWPGVGGLATEAEVIRQAGWAVVAGYSVCLGGPDRTTLAGLSSPPKGMTAAMWTWVRRALEIDTKFATVAAAKAALPT
jgi:hypothetical protein